MIRIKGGNKKQRKEAEKAIIWCARHLLSDRLLNNLSIKVYLIRSKRFSESWHGTCGFDDCNLRPREFSMEIDANQNREHFLTTICHEMIHVKQYVKEELCERYRPNFHQRWLGRRHDWSETDEAEPPWELEAHAKEKLLFKQMMSEVDW